MGEIVKKHRVLISGILGLVLFGLVLTFALRSRSPKQPDPTGTGTEPVQELAADETEQPPKPVADKSLRFLIEPEDTEVYSPKSFEKPIEDVKIRTEPEKDLSVTPDVVAVVERPFAIEPGLTLESERDAPPIIQNGFTVPEPPVVVSDPPITIRPLPPDTPLFEETTAVKAPELKVEKPEAEMTNTAVPQVPQAAPRTASQTAPVPQIVVQNIYPVSPMPTMYAMMPPMRVVTMVPVTPMPYQVVTVSRWTMPVLIYPNGMVVPQARWYGPGFP